MGTQAKTQRKKNQIDMLHCNIWKGLLRFALPLAATNLLQQLFNVTDIAIVGQFSSSEALSAVGVNAPLTNLVVNIFVGLSVGTNVVVANLLGKGDAHGVSRAVHTSIVVAFISGIIVGIAGPLLVDVMLGWMQTPENIFDMAHTYLTIYLLGAPFIMLLNFTSAILRSKGDTRRPFIVLVIAGIINVVLNIAFVVGLGMDANGVALATVIANAVSSIALLVILFRETDEVRVELKKLCFDWPLFCRIFALGVPAGIQGLMFSLSNVIIQVGLNELGSQVVAGSTAALNMEIMCYMIAAAFGQGAMTFVSQNHGAGNYPRCRSIVRWSTLLLTLFIGVASAFIVLFASFFSGLFSSDPEVIEFSNIRIYYVTSFEIVCGLIEIYSGALRGHGWSMTPAAICVVGICVLRIGWVYTAFAMWPTYECLLIAYGLSWVAALIGMVIAYFVCVRRIDKQALAANDSALQ
ncbi:MAG: MATE family efflux transporter [Eggerthellaceae bacterium]|nr:MATE family efflux transporter [Eggerthellaceae bacterium]